MQGNEWLSREIEAIIDHAAAGYRGRLRERDRAEYAATVWTLTQAFVDCLGDTPEMVRTWTALKSHIVGGPDHLRMAVPIKRGPAAGGLPPQQPGEDDTALANLFDTLPEEDRRQAARALAGGMAWASEPDPDHPSPEPRGE